MVMIEGTIEKNLIKGFPEEKTLKFFQDGFMNEMCDGFRNAVNKHHTSVVIIFDGRSGMGKTTLACQTGISLDQDFGLHKIHFTPETFLEGEVNDEGETIKVGLSNAKKGDYILFDEAMIISNRSAMSQINRMIIQAMSMIRSKNIYVGFCVNSIFDLDRNLVLHRADCLFHVYGESLVSRGSYCAFFKGKDGTDRLKGLYLNGKKYYDYSKPKANFIASFPKEFVVDDNEYEKVKQEGVKKFLEGLRHGKGGKVWDKGIAVYNLYKEGIPQHKIATLINMQPSHVSEYIKKYKEKFAQSMEVA